MRQAYRQLQDDKFYREVEEDLTSKHSAQIIDILSVLPEHKERTETQFEYLKPICARTARFYFLPKILNI